MTAYDWMRAIHIIAVIGWMAGLLMYPRLLVYRLEAEGNSAFESTMDDAARKLRRIILAPAMILAWLLGIGLASMNFDYYATQPWFWGKIVLVVALSGYDGWTGSVARKVAAGQKPLSSKRLRMLNEVPMLIAIGAVIAVVVQPFAN